MIGVTVLSEDKLGLLLKKHRRLANITLARICDNFSECDKCSDHKARLRRWREGSPEWISALHERSVHLNEIFQTRYNYTMRSLTPEVKSDAGCISGALSIVIDAPSQFKLRLPAFPGGRIPKGLTAQLSEGFMGVIVHKVSAHAIMIPWATSSKVDGTIESLFHVIADVQKNFTTPRKLYLQLDNHTGSNKTPAVLTFIAWLVETGVFTEAEINLLFPGHTHIDIDQLFSAWMRRVISRTKRNVTRSRLMESIRTYSRDTHQQPSIVTELKVREWSSFFEPEMQRLNIGRLGVSLKSTEAVYKFNFKKASNGVAMTYCESDLTAAVYPKPRQVGSSYTDESTHQRGEVTDVVYDEKTGLWCSYVQFAPSAGKEMLCIEEPPTPIMFFTGEIPVYPPEFSKLDSSKLDMYRKANRCIERACSEFTILRDTPGVVEEWQHYFSDSNRRISLCQQDHGPWFRGAHPPMLRLLSTVPVVAPRLELPIRTPFAVDPVTYRAFTGKERDRMLRIESARQHASAGSFAALQLLHGSSVPEGHMLPFCIVQVPQCFKDSDMAAVLPFSAFFSCDSFYKPPSEIGGAVAGKWLASASPLTAAKALVFCCGLELESMGDLSDDEVERMSLTDIKDELKARGLITTGVKSNACKRLKDALSISGSSRHRMYTGVKLTASSQARLLRLAPSHLLAV